MKTDRELLEQILEILQNKPEQNKPDHPDKPDKPPKPPKPPKPEPPVPPEPVEPPTIAGTPTAVNLTSFGHYGGVKPFINLMKHATRGWAYAGGWDEYVYSDKRDQWIRGAPPSPQDSFRNIIQVQDVAGETDFTRLRSGTYYLVWTGPLTCTIDGAGTENVRLIEPNKLAFDVPATDEVYANPAINLNVTNLTSTPQDFVASYVGLAQYPALYHADDEADFLAGKIFQRDWLNSLCGAKCARMMDWTGVAQGGFNNDGTDSLATIEPANFYDDACRTYQGSPEWDYFMPPEVIGRFAFESGMDVWYTDPAKASDNALAYRAKKFAQGAGSWSGRIWSEFNDESWNRAWPWYGPGQYLIDHVAPHINVVDLNGAPSTYFVDQSGCATAERAFKAWAAWEAQFGRRRVIRVLSGQWAAGAEINGMGGMFAYVDPVTGMKAADLADVYAVAPYWGLGAGDGTVTTKWLIENNAWNFPVSWWVDQCKLSIDINKTTLLPNNLAMLAAQAPKLKLVCYEGGGNPASDGETARVDLHGYTSIKTLDNFCRAFMNGDGGREVLQHYWDTLLNGNVYLFNHFFSNGYTLGLQMGLCETQFAPDTPRMKLFRTL